VVTHVAQGFQGIPGPGRPFSSDPDPKVGRQRVAVSRIIDLIAKDIIQGKMQVAAAGMLAAPAPGALPFMQVFGKPPATLADLSALNSGIERRLRAAVDQRTQQDLTAAIQGGDDRAAALALCQIFVSRFGCKVRDPIGPLPLSGGRFADWT
jgi:hypothetical protein